MFSSRTSRRRKRNEFQLYRRSWKLQLGAALSFLGIPEYPCRADMYGFRTMTYSVLLESECKGQIGESSSTTPAITGRLSDPVILDRLDYVIDNSSAVLDNGVRAFLTLIDANEVQGRIPEWFRSECGSAQLAESGTTERSFPSATRLGLAIDIGSFLRCEQKYAG